MTDKTAPIKLMHGRSFHGRYGSMKNDFRYELDCLLVPVGSSNMLSSGLLSKNKFNLFSFYDKDHGDGASIQSFANKIATDHGFSDICKGQIWLLTQPRFLGYVFNPVSFWFFIDEDEQLRVVLAEVNNTAGGRHFYLCHHDDFTPIERHDKVRAEKIFYVSPFQEIAGHYDFKFQFDNDRIGAWIDYTNGDQGVYATLTGQVQNITNWALLKSAFLRPFGALRVIALIHWQAMKLKLKGGLYRKAPQQSQTRISR